MSKSFSQYPNPKLSILHISDTHFVESDGKLHGSIDSDSNLAQLFSEFSRGNAKPDAIVFTGDLADTGLEDAYQRLKALVEPEAEKLGAELIWVMGNHDKRGPFREVLLGQDSADTSPIDRVFNIKGLRIIALDSTVPGSHHGELSQEQLDWLAQELSTPAELGTILALHHPPLPSPLGLIGLVELRDQQKLAEVIAGTDVVSILGGHLHYNTHSTFAGIPVSVASATCYTQDINVIYPAVRGQNGAQSYNLVHVYEDRVLHTVIPIGDYQTVYEVTAEQLEKLMALPQDQLDALMTTQAES